MEAEVYSYSRSKGLFAGISISGSAIDIDSKYNEAFYHNELDAKEIFNESEDQSPEVKALKAQLNRLYE
jgi:lipid-binding SYLF domain-containing protein